MYLLAKRKLGAYAAATDPAWHHGGVRSIRELSLLRNQMKLDLDIYGVFYFDDLDDEDGEFLREAGFNPKTWARPPWYRRIGAPRAKAEGGSDDREKALPPGTAP